MLHDLDALMRALALDTIIVPMGVRIEDTFVVTESGVESLCEGSRALEP